MKATSPRPTLLIDYRPPTHLVPALDLCFTLDDTRTRVLNRMQLVENPAAERSAQPLVLDGEELKLVSIKLDGKLLSSADYVLDTHHLTLPRLPKECVLEIETEINPLANTALDGLYKADNIFCTQNEPQGFRRITFFLDRSDVMSVYTTKIIAPKKYPILLSNGNPIGSGEVDAEHHWMQWRDPFPKPCYLFALVAGDLGLLQDTFTTKSGRTIDLRIYCEQGNENRCGHAMASLKKAMKWDEEVFGLEYDLDIFMIVAVDSFNMGAMENKGLNIFNTNCVLANPDSATDDNYARVESVIAHEYFHNWTGNRVTCRDWFQLTLKEGLTVFRDQEFSADMNSRPVERIDDILDLRCRQFLEDAGPTAHPIKPKAYIEINNFYTATVYNKGAEVIRMIQTLIGPEAFRRGIDTYFARHDSEAVTTEDFLRCMEAASGQDLSQFSRWYHQAGTPEVTLDFSYDSALQEFTIKVSQSCSETADGSPKEPFHFPLKIGLLGPDGRDFPLGSQAVVQVNEPIQTFAFSSIPQRPIPSINRFFSAPVRIIAPYSEKDLTFLMAHDSDLVNRWEACHELGISLMLQMLASLDEGEEPILDPGYVEAYGLLLHDRSIDHAFKSLALTLPQEDALAQRQATIDFDGNFLIRELMAQELALTYQDSLWKLYHELNISEPYQYTPQACGNRALKNTCLALLMRTGDAKVLQQCALQYRTATNMTDRFAAMQLLADVDSQATDETLCDFYSKWKHDKLVITKWLLVQGRSKRDEVLETVQRLEHDPVFDKTVPNLVRALYGSFTQNHVHFNVNSGEGYRFLAEKVLEMDAINPQIAAGLAARFRHYDKLDVIRKMAMKSELEHILERPGLSQNVYEIVSKCLQAQMHL